VRELAEVATTGPRSEHLHLRTGEAIDLHPMDGSDAAALLEFHHQLSPETTYLRYFTPHPELSPAELEHFTHVDHVDREAIVATANGHVIAVGRYDRRPGAPDAEVAFVVADAWQRHGIGSILLRHLVDLARARGIERLTAETLSTNRPMLRTFRASGLPMATALQGGVVHVELGLT
jgi:GNAT superfamily N-acetyltransferase